ncbi:MAG: M14 family zinc carboxypeptidase [Eubacteriales bacterium]
MSDNQTIYEDYRSALRALCREQNPRIIREVPFGVSHIGREIPALQLGEGGGHRLLYVGGITGSLYTTALLIRFAREYAESVRNSGRVCGIDISYLHHTRTITVVPLLNPDGAVLRIHGADDKNPLTDRLRAYAAPEVTQGTENADGAHRGNPFSEWVTNGRGVDLRCNCDAQFDACVRHADGIGRAGYPGMHPESEPECAAVCRYLRARAATDLTLLLDSVDRTDNCGRIRYSGSDFRTRSIACILARDMDCKSHITGDTDIPGSFGAWYRTLGAGPLLDIGCPGGGGFSFEGEDGDDAASARDMLFSAGMSASADGTDIRSNPGMTLTAAGLALCYGRMRKALFHGAVL